MEDIYIIIEDRDAMEAIENGLWEGEPMVRLEFSVVGQSPLSGTCGPCLTE